MIVACGRLLRVRRPKQTQASAEPEPEQEYEATVVGVVNQTYRFEGTPSHPRPAMLVLSPDTRGTCQAWLIFSTWGMSTKPAGRRARRRALKTSGN